MVTISVLGPVLVTDHAGPRRVPPGKSTELLVRLALDAGVEVRTDRLLDDLWGDDVAARNTIQSKVSMLRRALGGSVEITGSRSGYTLEVGPSEVDAVAVTIEQQAAERLLAAGDPASALATSEAALDRFHGDVLAEAGDGDWLVPHRARLEETRAALLETKLGAAIEVSPPGAAVAELEDLVRQHPLRERLWELLVTALYRAQRQADALDAYRRVRAVLDDELGLTPGPRLQALEQMVLRHDAALTVPSPSAVGGRASVRGNLPSLSSSLVGRADDVAAVNAHLAENRLVTVVGPAGVGKTRLAVEVAREAGVDETWLVRLEAARDADLLVPVVADALGLNGGSEAVVVDRLRAAPCLVVLDNCEHVADAAGTLARTLLDQVPGLRVLATSQVPLDLDGEVVHPLAPLALDVSVELFTRRSAERRQSFRLDPDTAAAVEDVCRALDGLPLAIELAAARTKALSVQEIARRLDDRFGLLNDPSTRRPERHRTLGTAIGWSYDLLFPDEKQVLWAVACFADGAPLNGVEAVAQALGVPGPAAVDALGRLADRSLVAVEVGAEGRVRYRLLDSVRAFTVDRLAEAKLTAPARRAHAEWFASRADDAAADERGPRQLPHLAFARAERANIDAALAWAAAEDPALGIRLTRGFGWGWVILGEAGVAASRTRAALAAADGVVTPVDRAVAWTQIAWNEAGADLGRAHEAATTAVALADATGDIHAIAESRPPYAFVLLQQGQAADAIDVLQSWRAGAGQGASAWQVGLSLMVLGYSALVSGDAALARASATEGMSVYDQVGDDWLVGHFESVLGQLALADGDAESAIAHLERAALAEQRAGVLAAEAFHLVALGRVQQLTGDLPGAARTLRAAIDSARSVGLMRVVALAQVQLGRVLLRLDEAAEAEAVLTTVDSWFSVAGGGEDAALASCLLATLPGADPERLPRLLDAARRDGNVEIQVLALDALARRRAGTGDLAGALALLAEADDLAPSVAHRVTPVDRVDAVRARALVDASG